MSAIPTKNVTLIKDRAGVLCEHCHARPAAETHHRMRRRDGHHAVSNLIRLCRECHSRAHANPRWAYSVGLIIPALRKPPLKPEEVPVRTAAHGWVLLNSRGTSERIHAALAMELLEVFGMLPRLDVRA